MYLVFTRMPDESYCRRHCGLCCCTCVTYFDCWLIPLRGIIIELIRITASILFRISTTPPENPDSPLKYWLSHSTKIRPGMPLAVSVYLSNTTGTVTLRVELVDRQGKQLLDGQEFVLHGAGIVVSLVLFRISVYPCLSIPLPTYLHTYIVCCFSQCISIRLTAKKIPLSWVKIFFIYFLNRTV